jgi:hypothetical protein
MASQFAQKPPVWFKIVAIILLLWGLAGCASLYGHFVIGPDMDPNATDYDRALYAALPVWVNIAYVVAVLAGLLGSIGLLVRAKWAGTLYLLSLIAVIAQFGYMFLATDIIAVKGVWTTYFPAFIFAVALFQVWFAALANRRGWLS